MAQLSRLVDAWCDAAREEERPPSRLFWKRLEERWSKERGGAMGRSPALQKGAGEESPWWLLFLVVAVVLFLVGGSVRVGAVPRPRWWDGASAIPLSRPRASTVPPHPR